MSSKSDTLGGSGWPRITVTDHRTEKSYELPVRHGTIDASDLHRVAVDGRGLLTYDPGFKHTASCRSCITELDGERGALRYRGYPIEQLAAGGSFLETAYLLIQGELPTHDELDAWTKEIQQRLEPPPGLAAWSQSLPASAHPMKALLSMLAAWGSFLASPDDAGHEKSLDQSTLELIAIMPALASLSYCGRHDLAWRNCTDDGISHAERFLRMMRLSDPAEPKAGMWGRVLDQILLLHADLEQNCSANVVRCAASAHADPCMAVAAGVATLSGPLHGGANERVLAQLQRIGSKDRIPALLQRVKNREERLMGFGHRVYRTYDPRARILGQLAEEVFAELGPRPLLEVARELERIAREDEFFVQRRLYPNVDFYSGVLLDAMGFPANEFTVVFAVARTVGWLAQYQELLNDPEQSIARPRQIYVGESERPYVPLEAR